MLIQWIILLILFAHVEIELRTFSFFFTRAKLQSRIFEYSTIGNKKKSKSKKITAFDKKKIMRHTAAQLWSVFLAIVFLVAIERSSDFFVSMLIQLSYKWCAGVFFSATFIIKEHLDGFFFCMRKYCSNDWFFGEREEAAFLTIWPEERFARKRRCR